MANFVVIAVLVLVVGAAITYIVKEKKKGAVCIGCSHAGSCGRKQKGDSGCSCH